MTRLKEVDRLYGSITTGGGTVSKLLPENAISIVRGSSKTFEMKVTDDTGAAVDFTGARVIFTVKEDAQKQNPLIQKDSNSGVSQVEISSPRTGVVRIHLYPSDTKALRPDFYVFDVWAVLVSGKQYPVIMPSVFEVLDGVTSLP